MARPEGGHCLCRSLDGCIEQSLCNGRFGDFQDADKGALPPVEKVII